MAIKAPKLKRDDHCSQFEASERQYPIYLFSIYQLSEQFLLPPGRRGQSFERFE